MKTKNKISDDVSKKLEVTIEQALEQIQSEEQFTNIKNDDAEEQNKSKRKKNSKDSERDERKDSVLKCSSASHIIAIVKWDKDKDDDTELPSRVEIPDNILIDDYNMDTIGDWLTDTVGYCHKQFSLSWPEYHENHEQFCEWEIEKAHIYDKTDPDFDYRGLYDKGDHIYFVRHSKQYNQKRLYDLKIRTIYPRELIGMLEDGSCQVIGMNEKNQIFDDIKLATSFYKSIQAESDEDYDENTGKKRRKRKSSKTEDDDNINEYIDNIDNNEDE